MSEGILLYQQLMDVEEAMERLSDLLDAYSQALPQAEYDYQTTKFERTKALLREYGITVVREIVRGDPDVAECRKVRDELRCKRQDAGREMQRLIGVHLRLRDDVNREYNRPSNR